MAETTSQLQQKLMALTNGKVNIMLNADEFKSTTQILREMAAVWQDMTDVQQAAALELLGGKRQANILSSLLQNFQTVEDVIQTSMASSGSALRENEVWLDSIEGKTYQFTNALQTMWSNILDSEAIKGFIDFGTDAIQFLDTAHGKIIALVAAVKLMAKFKGFSLAGIGQDFIGQIRNIAQATQTLQSLKVIMPSAEGLTTENINAYAAAVSNLTPKYQAQMLASQGLTKQQIQEAMTRNQCSEASIREATAHIHTTTTKQQEAAATQQLFVAKTKELAASYQNEAANLSEAASSNASAAAKILEEAASKNVSKAELYEIIVSSALEEQTKQQIIAQLGLATANKTVAATASTAWSTIGAIIASNPVGFILTIVSAVYMIAKAIGDANEKIVESAKEAEDAIESLTSSFKEDAKTVNDYARRFAELAQGVDMLTGKNISLTTDDYEEFLDLSNQLADIFPTLSRNYDENGNAIIQLSGDTDTMVGSLQALLDVQRQITNQKIAENLPDLYAGVKLKSDEYNTDIDALISRRDAFEKQLKYFQSDDFIKDFNESLNANLLQITNSNGDIDALNDMLDGYLAVLDKIGLSYEYLSTEYDNQDNVIGYNYRITDFDFMSEEEIAKAKQDIAIGISDLAVTYSTEIDNLWNEIQTKENENKANWSSLLSSIASWLSTDASYQTLSDDMQSVVQAMVNNIDFSKLDDVDTWDEMQKYIQDNIVSKIKSATPEVQKAFAQLFKIKTDDRTTGEYISAIKNQAQKIADSSDFTYDEVLKNTGFEDIINKYETSAQNILRVLDDSIPKYYEQYEAGTGAHFRSLEQYSAEVEVLKDKIYSLSPDDVTRAFDIIKKYGIKTWDDLVKALESKTFDVVLDYDAEKEGMDNLLAAIEESISATGLSAESIENLKKRYQDLDSFNPAELFEETTNGIHLNAAALRKLEKEYEKINKNDLDKKLEGLKEQYNDLTFEIEDCADASERALLYAQRNNVLTQINDTATLAAQYEGLTSAYKKWQDAQSGGNERDMYEGIISGKEEIDEEIARGWIDEGTRKYLELMSGQDLSTAGWEKILDIYKQLNQEISSAGYSINDFFTVDDDGNSTTEGIYNFFDTVSEMSDKIGREVVKKNEDGSYTFDFGVDGDKVIAEALGISEELVQIILRAAQDAGFEINLDSTYSELADLQDEAEAINDKLKELGATEYTFNINSTDLDQVQKQISEAKNALANLKNEDGTLKVGVSEEDYQNTQTLLATLIYQKQTLDDAIILKIDTSAINEGSVQTELQALLDYKAAFNDLEVKAAIGADTTEAEQKLDAAKAKLEEIPKEHLTTLKIDLSQTPEEINTSINNITKDALLTIGVNDDAVKDFEEEEHSTNGTVVWNNNIDQVTAWMRQKHQTDGTVKWKNNLSAVKTHFTATGTIDWSFDDPTPKKDEEDEDDDKKKEKKGSVDGTAHSSGTAFARGSWGAPKTETTLVGELGPEMLVRNGHWTTIGENGAEFTQVKKGDIIFNHKQTEDLLSKGYVTGRGKAYANGTAFSTGSGPGRYTVGSASIKGSGGSSSDELTDEFEEYFDWIEVKLEEINDSINLNGARLENAVGASAQNAIIDDMIAGNQELYSTLVTAADAYYSHAQDLLAKVPAEYRAAAQNGKMAIELFAKDAGEEALNAIQEYREWVQKGDEATQQAEETIAEIRSLAKQAFDNIATDYENQRSLRDNRTDQLESYNALSEAKYGSESTAIYEALIKNNKGNIALLKEQRDAMQANLNAQVRSGDIIKYSQAWYDAVNDIAAVDNEIIELTADTYDYIDAMGEIHWDNLDNILSRFEAISNEVENLLDILDNKDMVDEAGNWTDEGITSLGLYAQQMEIAEVEAAKYQDEIAYLNKNWKALGLTEQEYIEKLDELKSGQYDAIKAYHESKNAIVDLNKARIDAIKNGIQKEIDAFEELIKKKKELLDADKDLYDFEKSVNEQQKNIAKIERKLAALSTDNSSSAAAQRKKLEEELLEAKGELEDTFYERSIQNQQDALDKELENFQNSKEEEMEGWDEYLENTEQVVSDSLTTIQANTEVVYETLKSMGREYGLTIAETLTSPWKDGESAIQSYAEKFGLSMSSTVEELQKLAVEYKKIMDEIEGYGDKVVNQVNKNAESYVAASNPSGKVNRPSSPSKNKTPSGNPTTKQEESKSITVGGKINAGSARIYANSDGGGGSKQYFSSDPIYVVLGEQNGYLKVRHHSVSSGVTGWFRKSDVKAYAKGTKGIDRDQLALIDELGEELQLVPDGNGRLAYLKKGTAILNNTMTERLMDLAMNPQDVLDRSRPVINAPHIVNNEIAIDASIAELIHIDNVSNDTLPNLEKVVEKQMDKYVKNLNGQIRKYAR